MMTEEIQSILDDFPAHSEEMRERLLANIAGGRGVYLGIDPTGPGLHIGHLLPIMLLRRFAMAGVPTVLLMGTATAMVGDPTGRVSSRPVMNKDEMEVNAASLVPGSLIVQNSDWADQTTLLDFICGPASRVPLGFLLRLNSLRERMEHGDGASVGEAMYPLMQAMDFVHLAEKHGVGIQIGGSDQWGNISAGLELHRRLHPHTLPVAALTTPLLVRGDGSKMGKSAGGAIWLSPALTSDFEFHQFFLSCSDADLPVLMNLWPGCRNEKAELLALEGKEIRHAKMRLADEITLLIRGDAALKHAHELAQAVFGNGSVSDKQAILMRMGTTLLDAITLLENNTSRTAGRRLIEGGGVRVSGGKMTDFKTVLAEGVHDIQVGKREPHRVVIVA
jgi:tyrosyl-tRNA synthetase